MEQHTTEFAEAYGRATNRIMDAVLEFERETGHKVAEIALRNIDVTQIGDSGRRLMRDAHIHWQMTDAERERSPAWNDGKIWKGPSP
jgi:hypothetical protein